MASLRDIWDEFLRKQRERNAANREILNTDLRQFQQPVNPNDRFGTQVKKTIGNVGLSVADVLMEIPRFTDEIRQGVGLKIQGRGQEFKPQTAPFKFAEHLITGAGADYYKRKDPMYKGFTPFMAKEKLGQYKRDVGTTAKLAGETAKPYAMVGGLTGGMPVLKQFAGLTGLGLPIRAGVELVGQKLRGEDLNFKEAGKQSILGTIEAIPRNIIFSSVMAETNPFGAKYGKIVKDILAKKGVKGFGQWLGKSITEGTINVGEGIILNELIGREPFEDVPVDFITPGVMEAAGKVWKGITKGVDLKPKVDMGKLPEIVPPKVELDTSPKKIDLPEFAGPKGNTLEDITARRIGKETAAEMIGIRDMMQKGFDKIPEEEGWNAILRMEGTYKGELSDESEIALNNMRSAFEDLRRDYIKEGIEVGKIENYIPQRWKQSDEEVARVFSDYVRKNPAAAKTRTFKNYADGMAYGLTPKYTHPAPLYAEYVRDFETATANTRFVKELQEQKLIVPESVARAKNYKGYEKITAEGFPRSSYKIPGKGGKPDVIVRGDFYAKKEVADSINRMFRKQDYGKLGKFFERTGDISQSFQRAAFAGGAPGTPINAFVAAHIDRNVKAGNVQPIKALVQSMSDPATRKIFEDNIDRIIRMQENSYIIDPNLSLKTLIGNEAVKGFGPKFEKIMEDPTFKRFLPLIQLDAYSRIEDKLVASGMDLNQAAARATEAVRAFHGGTDAIKMRGKNILVEDIKRTFLLAPTYREFLGNFFFNAVKSLKNPLSEESRPFVKYLIGTAATYYIFNEANKAFNGRDMKDNPPWTKDKLLIPIGEDEHVGIPFATGTGILKGAFRSGKELVEVDLPGAKKEAVSTAIALWLQPIHELLKNEDYWDNEIVSEDDLAPEKFKTMFTYALSKYINMHPYSTASRFVIDEDSPEGVKEIFGYKKDQPFAVTVSNMLELPFRYYGEGNIKNRFYYESKEKYAKKLTGRDKEIYDSLDKLNEYDEDLLPVFEQMNYMSSALYRMSSPALMRAETIAALETAQKTGEAINPYYLLDPKQQYVVQQLKTFYPGDKQKSEIQSANIDWLKPFWAAQGAFYEELKRDGKLPESTRKTFREETATPPEIIELQDQYFALPKGDARRAFVIQNPELAEWWAQKKMIQNEQRLQLGLPLLEEFGSSSYGYGGKKSEFEKLLRPSYKKPPALKLSTPKVAKVSFKKPTAPPSIKPIDTKGFKIERPKLPSLGYPEKIIPKLKTIGGKRIKFK